MKACCLFLFLIPFLAKAQDFSLNRAKRVEEFEKSGILKQAEQLDELDQDILYFRLATKPESEIKKLYPDLPLLGVKKIQALT